MWMKGFDKWTGTLYPAGKNYTWRSLWCSDISSLFSGQVFPSSLVLRSLIFLGVTEPLKTIWKLSSGCQPLGIILLVQQGWVAIHVSGCWVISICFSLAFSLKCIPSTLWKNLPFYRLFYVQFFLGGGVKCRRSIEDTGNFPPITSFLSFEVPWEGL